MAYDVAKLKTDISSILHGTTLNSLQNVDQLIFRAASELLEDVDPQETKRIIPLSSPLFDAVYDYPCPSDLKGNKVIDIRPIVTNRENDTQFTQTYNKNFDLYKGISATFPTLTVNFNNGIKTLRLSKQLLEGTLVNEADSITGNGTWALGGDAINLVEDKINFASGNASLKFDLNGATGVGFIENSTMTPVDLTRDLDNGNEFLYSFLPFNGAFTPFTSVELRWGSSPTDYWVNTVSTNQALNAFENGWNLLDFYWNTATVVGAPNVSAVDYVRVTFNYAIGTPVNSIRIDSINSRFGETWEIEYYSKYLFRNLVTGAFQEEVTRDDNLINLDTESYMLLLNKCAQLAAQQNSGTDGGYDASFFAQQYFKSLQRYMAMYKSEVLKPKQNYYNRSNNNYRRWFGRGSGQR